MDIFTDYVGDGMIVQSPELRDHTIFMNGYVYTHIFSFSLQKDMKTAKDLDFWLEDLYTPGFDSLLKKKEAEQRNKQLCKILLWVTLSVCAVLVVIIVPVVVLKQKH